MRKAENRIQKQRQKQTTQKPGVWSQDSEWLDRNREYANRPARVDSRPTGVKPKADMRKGGKGELNRQTVQSFKFQAGHSPISGASRAFKPGCRPWSFAGHDPAKTWLTVSAAGQGSACRTAMYSLRGTL
jgi:hypothetical protein